MYKCRLQELCQRRRWELPNYATARDGPDHMLRFTASVTVGGQVFSTPAHYKSTKEAHNTVAQLALEHFSNLSPPLQVNHTPATAATPAIDNQLGETPTSAPVALFPEIQPVAAPPPLLPPSPVLSYPPIPHDILHIYKNQLQQFAHKKHVAFPMYTTEFEGPPNSRRFKSTVSVGGKSYQTMEFFTTLKEAEQAAAKVACRELSVNATQEGGGLYKNLLQELAQKGGFLCPSYETVQLGLVHRPLFSSTVEVGGFTFQGAYAKTKKQAEMDAARSAYYTLTKSSAYSGMPSISVCADDESFSKNIEANPSAKNDQDTSANIGASPTTTNHPDATCEGDKAAGYSGMPSISVCADDESCSKNIEANPSAEKCQDATANIKASPPTKNHQDATDACPQAKRQKYTPESAHSNGDTCIPCSPETKPLSDESILIPEPICEKAVEEQPEHCVYPCKLNLPNPESASGGEQSATNDVEQYHEPTAHQPSL